MEKAKRNEIAKGILYAIGATGLILTVAVLPGLAEILKPFQKRRDYNTKQIRRSLDNLVDRKLISMGKDGNKTVIRLTKDGEKKLYKYNLEDMKMTRPAKWDKKWWIVIFDIPENYKFNRTSFSQKLKELGFTQLQKSVWVWPYQCESEIEFLTEIYEIRPFVKLIRADYLDSSTKLREKYRI